MIKVGDYMWHPLFGLIVITACNTTPYVYYTGKECFGAQQKVHSKADLLEPFTGELPSFIKD